MDKEILQLGKNYLLTRSSSDFLSKKGKAFIHKAIPENDVEFVIQMILDDELIPFIEKMYYHDPERYKKLKEQLDAYLKTKS